MKINWKKRAAQIAESGHAIFGFSTLPRLFRCPGSVQALLTADLPPVKDEEYTSEGVKAHELAAYEVNSRFFSEEFFYPVSADTREMYIACEEYADYCYQQFEQHCDPERTTVLVEERLDVSVVLGVDHQFGTPDFVMYDETDGTLWVIEFKYGKGKRLFAVDNEQLLGQAVAAMVALGRPVHKAILVIQQPRMPDDPRQRWEVDGDYLWAFLEMYKQKVAAAMEPGAMLYPGKTQCQFCPLSGMCGAQMQAAIAATNNVDFTDVPLAQQVMTPEQISQALELIEYVDQWKQAVRKKAMASIAHNVKIPGWMIGETSAHRKFVDEEQVAAYARWEFDLSEDDLWKKELVSPAQMEKMLRKPEKEKLKASGLIDQPRGKPVLVRESSGRKAYQNPAEHDFDGFEPDDFEDPV
jgi:hypothetical protein